MLQMVTFISSVILSRGGSTKYKKQNPTFVRSKKLGSTVAKVSYWICIYPHTRSAQHLRMWAFNLGAMLLPIGGFRRKRQRDA
jgi:hypothetical protein